MAVPTNPEPHYAQIIHRDKINTIEIYEKDESKENAVWNQENTRIVRDGDEVHVYGVAMRSKFIFDAEGRTSGCGDGERRGSRLLPYYEHRLGRRHHPWIRYFGIRLEL